MLFLTKKINLIACRHQWKFYHLARDDSSQCFQTFFQPTLFAAKGHLNQERKNLQSTKIIQPSPLTNKEEIDMLNDHFPINENLHSPTNECMAIIMPFTSKDTGYADLTGRFPFVSSRGNQYLLIVYDYDSNAILAEPIKSRRAKDITTAFQKIHKKLSKRGAAPKFYILDNEISGEFKSALDKTSCNIN